MRSEGAPKWMRAVRILLAVAVGGLGVAMYGAWVVMRVVEQAAESVEERP